MFRFDDHCREERYFSATILPYLMAYENFTGLKAFLSYINDKYLSLTDAKIDLSNFDENIKNMQMITEPALERDLPYYKIPIPTESFGRKKDKQSKPDILIIFNGWVILIEAKYFTSYNPYGLYMQMDQQSYVLDIVKTMSEEKIINGIQLAICPIHDYLKEFSVITWEEIYNIMRTIIPKDNYFMKRLKNSITRY